MPAGVYGLVAGAFETAGAEDLSSTQALACALWSSGIMLLSGAAMGIVAALPVVLRRNGATDNPPARWACFLQASVIALALSFVYLNHQLTRYTDEAMTPGAAKFLLSNPTEVLDMAWRFAGTHLTILVLATLAAPILLTRPVRNLNARLLGAGDGKQAGLEAGIVCRWLTRCRPSRVAGMGMILLFVLPAALLAMQFSGEPSPTLVRTSNVFPPLRAIQLSRWLVRSDVEVTAPTHQGQPIVAREDFVAGLEVDRRRLRNVLIVLLESVPAKALHCYGYHRDVTPNLDALAREGVLFERCYAAASFSSYSQISTLTSLYMLRGESNDHFADIDFPHVCLNEVLGPLGYTLTVFSSGNESWDNLESFYPADTFDLFFSHNHCDVPKTDCNRMDDKHAMTAFAAFVRSRPDDRPFYSYINLQSTHFNYEVPEPWASRYGPVPPPFSNGDGIIRIPAETLPLLRNQYDNALTYLDHWVGFLRDTLAEAGELERSILVFVGDHGEGFMEHGLARHGMHLWNEMIHVPLILYAPGLLEPQRKGDVVSQIDILPTVACLLGLAPHPSWQGVNVLARDYDDARRPVFSVLQLTRYQLAMVWGDIKVITDRNTGEEWLFHLADDPEERDNLAAGIPPPTELEEVRRMVARWRRYQVDYYASADATATRYVGMPTFEQLRQDP